MIILLSALGIKSGGKLRFSLKNLIIYKGKDYEVNYKLKNHNYNDNHNIIIK